MDGLTFQLSRFLHQQQVGFLQARRTPFLQVDLAQRGVADKVDKRNVMRGVHATTALQRGAENGVERGRRVGLCRRIIAVSSRFGNGDAVRELQK